MRRPVLVGTCLGFAVGLILAMGGALEPREATTSRAYELLGGGVEQSEPASASESNVQSPQDVESPEAVASSGTTRQESAEHPGRGDLEGEPSKDIEGEPSGDLEGEPNEDLMRGVVLDLLQRRDEALVAKDLQSLEGLSVEASPARAADVELLGRISEVPIVELDTSLVEAKLTDAMPAEALGDGQDTGPGGTPGLEEAVTVQVRSIQERLVVEGQNVVGPLPERCARWLLVPNPWRLLAIDECED